MATRGATRNFAVGAISGYAGHKVMGTITTRLEGMESPADKQQEQKVSKGVSYDVAARQLSQRVGAQLSDEQVKQLGTVLSYGLALAGGELYMLLRRQTSLNPFLAALVMSMSLFLGFDEGLTPAMGWSAPDPAYPLATHLRGFLGHLSLGATVAVTAELLSWLAD